MYRAVKKKKRDKVQKYLNKGADPNYKPEKGESALVIAVTKGYEGTTAILLEAKSDANQSDKNGTRILTIAIKKGLRSAVEKLMLAKADITYRDEDGYTPLLLAAKKGDYDIMSSLINAKADLNAVDTEGRSALHYCARWRNESLAALLMSSKAQVNLPDSNENTPLHLAAFRGCKEVIDVLVKHGANIDAVNKDGLTPLCVSIEQNMDAAACLLVRLKANINIKPMEISLLQAATNNGLEDTIKELNLVMEQNLIKVALNNNFSLVQKLLNDGVNPNCADQNNTPLLHLVLTNIEILKILIDKGKANVNIVDEKKETTMHAAARQGLSTAVSVLLPHGDLSLRNGSGETPLIVAIKRGYSDIAKTLYDKAIRIDGNNKNYEDVGEEMVTLGKEIGKGGFGIVHRGKFKGQEVAVKVQFTFSTKSNEDRKNELDREVDNMTRIHSPYVLNLIAVAGKNTGKSLLVLPLMNGYSLRTYLDGKLGIEPELTQHLDFTKLEIAWVIANAILDLHTEELIHRDLKSLNVLLCSKNYIKVSDLGSARHCESGMTTAVGTHEWMAPEVFNTGSDYTEAADIYSFGVILTELDTCIEPYANFVNPPPKYSNHPRFKDLGKSTLKSRLMIEQEVRKNNLRPVVRPDCEPWYKKLVDECLARNPVERPTAQQIVDKLREQIQK
ncbi:serine/threonine-protein kinase TNNI3K [Thraustotheca clavata]|uniref:Serine/threonine-protein kinase TNNI3K n=1 Tax=Thraustotheca clavata TaxID=74557 RepID=A0A1V9ZZ50_9STRA|nr:serine/threonine-protein kinase TNNI3K [Thraustotheca clavata]